VYLKANVNLGELTDTIISQNYVGSVMKVWEDNIYIFITMAVNNLINLKRVMIFLRVCFAMYTLCLL